MVEQSGRNHPYRRRVSTSFRLSLIQVVYLPNHRGGPVRRRRTIIGRCCEPFCSGGPAKHPGGAPSVAELLMERRETRQCFSK
jgi:hypothetical protein